MYYLILAAGRGERFKRAGYSVPKCLLDVNGTPLVVCVMENIGANGDPVRVAVPPGSIDFPGMLRQVNPRAEAHTLEISETGPRGPAIHAKSLALGLPRNTPIVISYCDQLISTPDLLPQGTRSALVRMKSGAHDAGMITFTSVDPKFGYARATSRDGEMLDVQVKRVISRHASAGIFYFKEAGMFVDAVTSMVAAHDQVQGEYYVERVFNHLPPTAVKRIFSLDHRIHCLGDPESYLTYLMRYIR